MNEARKTLVLENIKIIATKIKNAASSIVHGSSAEACFTLGCLYQICIQMLEILEPGEGKDD